MGDVGSDTTFRRMFTDFIQALSKATAVDEVIL